MNLDQPFVAVEAQLAATVLGAPSPCDRPSKNGRKAVWEDGLYAIVSAPILLRQAVFCPEEEAWF